MDKCKAHGSLQASPVFFVGPAQGRATKVSPGAAWAQKMSPPVRPWPAGMQRPPPPGLLRAHQDVQKGAGQFFSGVLLASRAGVVVALLGYMHFKGKQNGRVGGSAGRWLSEHLLWGPARCSREWKLMQRALVFAHRMWWEEARLTPSGAGYKQMLLKVIRGVISVP